MRIHLREFKGKGEINFSYAIISPIQLKQLNIFFETNYWKNFKILKILLLIMTENEQIRANYTII